MTQQSHSWAYTLRKTIIQKDTCTPMLVAALFTIVRTRKQPKCPSTEEWIKNMWYIYTVEYYSAIKRKEIGSFVEMWMDLETVIWSNVSQKEKNKYHILTHVWNLEKMVQMKLFAKQKQRHRRMDTKEGRGRWDELGDWD